MGRLNALTVFLALCAGAGMFLLFSIAFYLVESRRGGLVLAFIRWPISLATALIVAWELWKGFGSPRW